MTTPNTPQNSPNSPELQRELEQLWAPSFRADLAAGRLSTETRKFLTEALGKEKLDTILRETGVGRSALDVLSLQESRVEAYTIQRICREMAATRAGFFHLAHEHNPRIKASRELLWAPPLVPGAPPFVRSLGSLVNDPDTKEADAFFWAYSQLSNNGNVATLVTIFEQVTQDETEDAATLSKMQTLSKEILEDKEYFNIGEEGKITRTPGTAGAAGLPGSKSSPPIPAVIPTATLYQVIGGDGALEQLQQEWVNWRNDAELELIRDKGDPKPAREEATKCKTKIDQLNAKRRTLQTKLTQINALARKLHPAPGSWDKDDIEDWSKTFTPDFFENTIPDYTLTDIELGDKTHSILEWLEDEKLRDTQERITRRFRMAGEGQPPASLVLDDLIRTYFGPRLAGASTGEQEQFYREMREILLSAEHGHAAGHSGATAGHATGAHAAPQTPSASHGGGHGTKPPGRSWKELFFGK